MINSIYTTVIFSIILAIMLYTGIVKMVKVNFKIDPLPKATQGQDVQKSQSQRAADIEEKTRRLMERTRAQMERSQAKMDRLRH